MTTTATCKATTRSGEPCRSWTVNDSNFCFWHDPGTVQARAEARSKGGRARHGRKLSGGCEPVRIQCAPDVLPILEATVNDLLRLENSIARARAITYVCATLIKGFEMSELDTRVQVLELRYEQIDVDEVKANAW